MQLIAVLVTAVWAFVLLVAILKIVGAVMGLRVTPEEEEMGLDMTQHGQYAFRLDRRVEWAGEKARACARAKCSRAQARCLRLTGRPGGLCDA